MYSFLRGGLAALSHSMVETDVSLVAISSWRLLIHAADRGRSTSGLEFEKEIVC